MIKYPIKNHQFTLIMAVMVMAVAASTVLTMPRAEDPDMKTPTFPVIVAYPGTSPGDMENLVAKPLESRIYDLDDIREIKTTVSNGLAYLYVEFHPKADYEDKYQELVRELTAARSELPDNVHSIHVHRIEPSNVSVIQAALVSGTASRTTLKRLADELKAELEKIPALKHVEIAGLPDRQVRIDLHLARMAELGIPMDRVAQAVQGEAANIPGGSVDAGARSFSVKTGGGYQSIAQIRRTVVVSAQGRNIFLRDIADVYPTFGPAAHATRLNGYRCLLVNAAQKEGENISRTQKRYKTVLADFRERLPADVDLVLTFDQGDHVNRRLGGLGLDFLIAIGLVLLTLLPLGGRASLVVMIAIPLSLGLGLIALNMAGYSLNQLSIVGFVVALGLVVDDSIVVVENIERWMREGHSRLQAAVKGTEQIVQAVVGCTATLAIAFLPLMFMPDMAGDFIRSMPTAVIASVVGSMFVALLVVPLLASKLLRAQTGGNAVLRVFQRGIHATYGRLLEVALRHPGKTVLVAIVVFLASLALVPVIGFSLFPPSEKPQFMVHVWASPQASWNTTDSIVRRIEADLRKTAEVEYFTSNVGRGNPRVYYNMGTTPADVAYADIFVQLHGDVKSADKIALIERLRRQWTPYLGAKVEVRNFEQGIPMAAPVEVRIFGESLDSLRLLARRTEDLLQATSGTAYVHNPLRNNKSDLRVRADRDKAMALGVSPAAIDHTVRIALAGYSVGTYTPPGSDNEGYDILLTVPRGGRATIGTLDGLFVNNVLGRAVPLAQVARLELEASPPVIYRKNKTRNVTLRAFVADGHVGSRVIADVVRQMDAFAFPPGYSYEMGGEVENRERTFGGFGTIIIVTAFLFTAVLVLEFRTMKSTLIVLSVIPLGIVGAVLALLLTGNTLSFVATVGLIALAGIEVKNTILLVDFTNQLRRQGVGLDEAIEKAGEMRFLPIVLTAMTSIGGLLPIAWSSNPLISPLAIVMIGGLASSTLLSRVVTPVIYKLMPPKVGRVER